MIKRAIHLTITLFLIVPLFLFFPSISPSQDATDEILDIFRKSPKLNDADLIFKDFFEGKARTRVMVGIRKPARARSMQKNLRNMNAREQLKHAAQATQRNVISTLDQNEVRITNSYNYLFGFAAEVTRQGLQALIDNPDVMFIEKDKIVYAHLAQGIPLMNASTTRSTYNGSGVAIAICDTGIDYTHSKLGNGGFPNSKVIGGYDFGDNDSNPMDLEGHGTACAGIAAGDLGTVGDYIGGVAYGAKLYALKISLGATGSAYYSAIANAWDWCILHQYDDLNNPIMIISTSFGGGRYSGNCDSEYSLLTHAAANAMAAGMTLFISSGNNGYCDSIGYPACLDSVVSVGAVYDANIGRNPITGYIGCISYGSCVGTVDPDQVCEKLYIDVTTNADQICTYSNSSKFASLLAPANWATTTKLGGGYWDTANGFGGTSAACPYAAGAAAGLQSAAKAITGSYLTHHQVKATLVDTGDLITDEKVNITKPRLNLGAAVATLYSLIVPTAPTIAVTTSGTTVTVSWDAVAHTNGYILNYAPYPYSGPDSIVRVDKKTQTSASFHLWRGAAFYVAVQAYNFVGDSNYSNIEYFIID